MRINDVLTQFFLVALLGAFIIGITLLAFAFT